VIWQRFTAPRATLALHSGGRRTIVRAGTRRQGGCARVAQVPPLTIREPESTWWRAHDEREARREPDRPATVERDAPVVTVAVVGDSETGWNTDAVVSRLAELAVNDELVVVYGRRGPGYQAVMAGMRGHLPRHHIVGLHVRRPAEVRRDTGAALRLLLEDGSLPVVVTTAEVMYGVAAEISSALRADRVLRVSRTPGGADLHQVWRRRPAPSVSGTERASR
jgi:hypothetical protein